jgi:hypothetical protein
MNTLISCCGLNCAECDARIATINNDDELRAKTAETWTQQFNASISAEMINCAGCREEGAKFAHCSECEVRNCVKSKGYDTCGDCEEMISCAIVGGIHQYVPEAVANLQSLKK